MARSGARRPCLGREVKGYELARGRLADDLPRGARPLRTGSGRPGSTGDRRTAMTPFEAADRPTRAPPRRRRVRLDRPDRADRRLHMAGRGSGPVEILKEYAAGR